MFFFHYQHTSSERLPDKYNAVIKQVHSTVDQDGDGIDGQIDILQEDIRTNPNDYNIDEPDANIDFGRVANLKVYFAYSAVSLTTDISEIEDWQGGDIVIFENHIGIVSDRRNEKMYCYCVDTCV